MLCTTCINCYSNNICWHTHSNHLQNRSPRDKTSPCSMRQRESGRMPHCFLWHTENAYLRWMIAADNPSPALWQAQQGCPLLPGPQFRHRPSELHEGEEGVWPRLSISIPWLPPPAQHVCSSTWVFLEAPACTPSALPCYRTAKTLGHPLAIHISARRWQTSEQFASPEVCKPVKDQNRQYGRHSSAF